MKLEIRNNICKLTREESLPLEFRTFLATYLTKLVNERQVTFIRKKKRVSYSTEIYELYSGDANEVIFPRGLWTLMESNVGSYLEVIDNSTNKYNMESELEDIESVLRPEAPFDLRSDQVMAVKKALLLKRGVIQIPTGSGKTEVMSAVIKKLESVNSDIHILVIEPTDVLVRKTSDRFNRYNLHSFTYNEVRSGDLDGVNVLVAHTKSLLNDCEKDPHLLEDFDAVFWDECQHCKCDTWKQLNSYLHNVEYAIGLSALAVNEDRIYTNSLDKLSLDEAMIIGSTGKVILYIPVRYYIDKNILATPVIFQIYDDLTTTLDKIVKSTKVDPSDWHFLRKDGIESVERTELIAMSANLFVRYDRRVLILVGTKSQAQDISNILAKSFNLNGFIGVSFGGGESYSINESGGFEKYSSDIISDFDENKFSILISTNHLDEGIDLSNLDVCILASGGKKDRRIVQRIGRALRVNKTGKYAYIVDFFDEGNPVLEKHSRMRMKLFADTIEVPEDLIFKKLMIQDAEGIFLRLEELDV